MNTKEFIRKLENYSPANEDGDTKPCYFIEDIREAEEEYGIKFNEVYFTFGKDAGWSEMGYWFSDFDPIRSFTINDIPDYIADRAYGFYSIEYDEEDNTIDIALLGNPKLKEEITQEVAYNKWLKERRYLM